VRRDGRWYVHLLMLRGIGWVKNTTYEKPGQRYER